MAMTQEKLNEALLEAAEKGDLEKVCGFVAEGAPIDVIGFAGFQPLHVAAQNGCLSVVEFLLFQGAVIGSRNRKDGGMQALHYAAQEGHLSVVELLLSSGARIDSGDEVGVQALHYASSGGHLSVVESLFEKGARLEAPDKSGARPLHWAAMRGNLSVVEFLLKNGADPAAKDRKKQTAFEFAKEYPEVRDVLKQWSDPEFREKRQAAIIRAHWKRVARHARQPGPGM